QQNGQPFFLNSYPKPAFGYLYVKDMLGDALFTKALHTYIRQWRGKHPMPNDFFYSMNAGAGQNMNWFWKRWFFDDGVPDLAITAVTNSGNNYKALITNKGGKPVPVDLTISFADGTTKKLHQSIAAWKAGNTTVTVPFMATKKPTRIELGSTYVPDSEPKDNVWKRE
ncbi:MAG: peptidase, partial [Flaviaesturariibacter sp.]|nr:peptidase [Flaviaesturariibacter sp.]